jgi:chemotaxis signal transduction protein
VRSIEESHISPPPKNSGGQSLGYIKSLGKVENEIKILLETK